MLLVEKPKMQQIQKPYSQNNTVEEKSILGSSNKNVNTICFAPSPQVDERAKSGSTVDALKDEKYILNELIEFF